MFLDRNYKIYLIGKFFSRINKYNISNPKNYAIYIVVYVDKLIRY